MVHTVELKDPLDLRVEGPVEVRIRADRNVLWVNTEAGCALRISAISHLEVVDESGVE